MRKVFLVMAFAFIGLQCLAQFSKGTLQATGLTCAMCSNAINKALKAVPFVESVVSNIRNSSFDIVFKAGSDVNIDALKKAVEDAGFSVGNLKLTGNFNQLAITADKHVKVGNTYLHFLNGDNQTLNGEKTITVVDKNFVTAKEFRKVSTLTKMSCLQSGKAGSCCEKDGIPANERIYHVTI